MCLAQVQLLSAKLQHPLREFQRVCVVKRLRQGEWGECSVDYRAWKWDNEMHKF